ncbi:hypothetical protein ACP70R_049583 [Stipagrostis hirtigluma subsp. patula]
MMEGEPMVCYWTGAINSLVDKLTRLLENHPVLEELLRDLESLRNDIVSKFRGGRATDEQVKVWMKHVRELVYEIEDWLDPKLKGGGGRDDRIYPKRPVNFLESEIDRKHLQEFKAQIQEARDRCTRYNLLHKAMISDANLVDAGPSEVAVGCGSLWEKTVLVGLDGPKRELEEHLKDEQKKLKVVSVLGVEGIGKTTLAKEIYDKLKGQFECQAFVSVGQNMSTETILMDIHRQVGRRWNSGCCDGARVEQEIISDLSNFLSAKRYFIFIDDIRSTWAWSIIHAALPDNTLGSRILTTTCIKDVAGSCSRRPIDVVYQMKALGHDDSRNLLLIQTPVPNEERPVDFEEASDIILKMCGGLPLPIIVAAGLLSRKSAEVGTSKVLQKSMPSSLDKYSITEGIQKILEISFSNLPLSVKSCFLYLAAFRGYYTIKKDCLIRRWVAEGLLPRRVGKKLWETGESYFSELVTRRLIQPVFDSDDDKAVGCIVHGVIHDFITSLSRKENFITTGAELCCRPFPCDTIRRFSVDCRKQEEFSILASCKEQLSRVRSLTIYKGAKRMHDLCAFELILVLDIEGYKFSFDQLVTIGSLSLLKYLRLRGSVEAYKLAEEIGQLSFERLNKDWATIDHSRRGWGVFELPKEIGQLEHLTTLDIRHNGLCCVPAFTSTKLVSLLADEARFPRGIEGMQELEELSTIRIDTIESLDATAKLVNKSKQLRMLGVRFGRADQLNVNSKYGDSRKGINRFLSEVGESSLQHLFLDCYRDNSLDLLLDCWGHKRLDHLQTFMLRISNRLFRAPQKVPQEIAFLVKLTHLHIIVKRVEAEGLRALGRLPNLVLLDVTNSGAIKRCTVSKDGFQGLKVFCFECCGTFGVRLRFEEGAMPQLRRLQLRRLRLQLNILLPMPRYRDFDSGIQYLSCLVQVSASIIYNSQNHATASQVEALEAAITEQVSRNPNNPKLELSRE